MFKKSYSFGFSLLSPRGVWNEGSVKSTAAEGTQECCLQSEANKKKVQQVYVRTRPAEGTRQKREERMNTKLRASMELIDLNVCGAILKTSLKKTTLLKDWGQSRNGKHKSYKWRSTKCVRECNTYEVGRQVFISHSPKIQNWVSTTTATWSKRDWAENSWVPKTYLCIKQSQRCQLTTYRNLENRRVRTGRKQKTN